MNYYYWELVSERIGIRGGKILTLKCTCGNIKELREWDLQHGVRKSCGCMRNYLLKLASSSHGMNESRTYHCWEHMKQRCLNKNDKTYPHYGGRGITICEEWIKSFENFYADMGEMPYGLSLDRINNNGNYCKENCRWASNETQLNNTSRNKLFLYRGELKTCAQICKGINIKQNTVRERIRNGWDIEKALNTPVRYRATSRQ